MKTMHSLRTVRQFLAIFISVALTLPPFAVPSACADTLAPSSHTRTAQEEADRQAAEVYLEVSRSLPGSRLEERAGKLQALRLAIQHMLGDSPVAIGYEEATGRLFVFSIRDGRLTPIRRMIPNADPAATASLPFRTEKIESPEEAAGILAQAEKAVWAMAYPAELAGTPLHRSFVGIRSEGDRELINPPLTIATFEMEDAFTYVGTLKISETISHKIIARHLGISDDTAQWDEFWRNAVEEIGMATKKELQSHYPWLDLFKGKKTVRIVYGKSGSLAHWDTDGNLVITLDLLAKHPQETAGAQLPLHLMIEAWGDTKKALQEATLLHEGLHESPLFRQFVLRAVPPSLRSPEVIAALTEIYASNIEFFHLARSIHENPLILSVLAHPSNAVHSVPVEVLLSLKPENVLDAIRMHLMEPGKVVDPQTQRGLQALREMPGFEGIVSEGWKAVSQQLELAQTMREAAASAYGSLRHWLRNGMQYVYPAMDMASWAENSSELQNFTEVALDKVKKMIVTRYELLTQVENSTVVFMDPGKTWTLDIENEDSRKTPAKMSEQDRLRLRIIKDLIALFAENMRQVETQLLEAKTQANAPLQDTDMAFEKKKEAIVSGFRSLQEKLEVLKNRLNILEKSEIHVEGEIASTENPLRMRLSVPDADARFETPLLKESPRAPAAWSQPFRFWQRAVLPVILAALLPFAERLSQPLSLSVQTDTLLEITA